MKFYYYFFYQFYKFWDYISVPKFWSDWKAGLSIIILEIWICLTILNFYDIVNNLNTDLSLLNPIVIIPFLLIIILNYIAFIHSDSKWKIYNYQFDNFSKRKKIVGAILVWTIALFIITMYFFSTLHLHKLVYGAY